ncbi:SUN domain-containing protein 3 [Chironomus tepperi]|uniref:SUN domain-containing protein 3 n=1 Tax=Chironomus tepperi TaxID=113505 RepID=UPI00391F2625
MEVYVQKINDIIQKARKLLLIVITVILLLIYIRGCINQITFYKEDIEYLQNTITNLQLRIENGSKPDIPFDPKDVYNAQREFLHLVQQIDMKKSELQHNKVALPNKERYDFALENIGGSVVSYHDTELMYSCGLLTILIGKCKKINPPEKAIQKNVEPGEAFCFKGNQGSITIKLSCPIVIDSITFDHVERSSTPNLDISDAPRFISISGMNMKHDENEHDYGNFSFNANDSNSQSFYFGSSSEKYQYIKINITENHGHQDRTCIYRIQVHGYDNEC